MFNALGELNRAGELKTVPLTLSKASSKVLLANVASDGTLTFQAKQGSKQASFKYQDLTTTDHAFLACLVARFRPTNPEAQVYAGIFMERTGDTEAADTYYAKADPELVG
jgi:hypothetical protein